VNADRKMTVPVGNLIRLASEAESRNFSIIDIGQTSVAKHMVKRRGPPSQGWKTFLHNHADGIAAMDLFVVPTISFCLLYGLLIMGARPTTNFVVWRHS
jgi:hypothetical protein